MKQQLIDRDFKNLALFHTQKVLVQTFYLHHVILRISQGLSCILLIYHTKQSKAEHERILQVFTKNWSNSS